MYYCGIDIAKRRHEATVIDEDGAALADSISFANSKEGCEKLLALFQRLGISKDDLLIGMEATGHYWLSVYEALTEQGYDVKVINPIQSEAFRKMYIRPTKNDSRDSFIIAQIMRFGQFSAAVPSEETMTALRHLSRYRLSLVDACSDCKRRVIALSSSRAPLRFAPRWVLPVASQVLRSAARRLKTEPASLGFGFVFSAFLPRMLLPFRFGS